jgi:hypothetical protein
MGKDRDLEQYGVSHKFEDESENEEIDDDMFSNGGKEIFLRNANIIIKTNKEFQSKCDEYELSNIKKVLKNISDDANSLEIAIYYDILTILIGTTVHTYFLPHYDEENDDQKCFEWYKLTIKILYTLLDYVKQSYGEVPVEMNN